MKRAVLNNKWLIISPAVFVDFVNEHTILLYNTKNGYYVISHDSKLISLVTLLYQPKNSGVINASTLENYTSSDIELTLNGGLIYVTDAAGGKKPINYLPILNLQKDLDKYDEKGIDGRLQIIGSKLRFISGVYITLSYANNDMRGELCRFRNIAATQHPCPLYGNPDTKLSPDNVSMLLDSLKFTSTTRVDFICSSSYFECFCYSDFLGLLSQYKFSYRFHIYTEDFDRLMPVFQTLNYALKLEFIIYDDRFSNPSQMASNEVSPYKTKRISLIYNERELRSDNEYMLPVWTDDNIEFFRSYVWIEQRDIDSAPVNWSSIFRNQKLNSNFFGIIDIAPDGNIYPHGSKHSIGNICDTDFSLADVVIKEFKENHTWRLTRDHTKCNPCPYRFICPPVSIFEIQFDTIKMCHINYN